MLDEILVQSTCVLYGRLDGDFLRIIENEQQASLDQQNSSEQHVGEHFLRFVTHESLELICAHLGIV